MSPRICATALHSAVRAPCATRPPASQMHVSSAWKATDSAAHSEAVVSHPAAQSPAAVSVAQTLVQVAVLHEPVGGVRRHVAIRKPTVDRRQASRLGSDGLRELRAEAVDGRVGPCVAETGEVGLEIGAARGRRAGSLGRRARADAAVAGVIGERTHSGARGDLLAAAARADCHEQRERRRRSEPGPGVHSVPPGFFVPRSEPHVASGRSPGVTRAHACARRGRLHRLALPRSATSPPRRAPPMLRAGRLHLGGTPCGQREGKVGAEGRRAPVRGRARAAARPRRRGRGPERRDDRLPLARQGPRVPQA